MPLATHIRIFFLVPLKRLRKSVFLSFVCCSVWDDDNEHVSEFQMRSTRAEGNFRFMNSRNKTRISCVLGPKRTLGSWNSRDKTLETDACVLLQLISCCS
jgi:hypothetical protein